MIWRLSATARICALPSRRAAYYAELAARNGIEPDEALMVGDSMTNDIQPAQKLGIHTRHITDTTGASFDFMNRFRVATGKTAICPRAASSRYGSNRSIRGNPGALYGLLSEVQAHQWQQRPQPEEWSILQILCHLRESETEVQQQRLKAILREDNPFIATPPAPGPQIPPCHHEGYEVMNQFRRHRLATIDLLAQLNDADWRRPARHSIFGLTNLLEMAYFTAQHDRLHITQLCQTLGKCNESIFH